MKTAVLICAICVICGGLLCFGSQSPAFEVASITLLKTGTPHGMLSGCHGSDSKYPPASAMSGMVMVPPVAQCVLNGFSLPDLIAYETGIRASQVVGGPDWVASDKFEVKGKAPDGSIPTEAELKQMLLRLMADRFQLKFHHETRQMSGYVLLVAKGGPKIEKASGNESQVGLIRLYRKISGQNITMAQFVNYLWDQMKAPVVDKTGLTGNYTFTMDMTNGDKAIPLETMLDQIGMRLESQKIPVEFIVIDSAERPAEK